MVTSVVLASLTSGILAFLWLELILIILPPYIFAGMAISLALTRSPWPVGIVYVCSVAHPATGTVEVAIRGWVSALVPPGFGLGSWRTGALAINIDDVVHSAVFAP